MTNQISWSDFEKIDMRVGTIIQVEDFANAVRPAYKVWIDFGDDIGIKKTSAQLKDFYNEEQLMGRQVIAVTNFPPKQIADFMSECLILAAVDEQKRAKLLGVEQTANGHRIA